MSIIRSVILQIIACGMVSCCSGGLAVRRAAAWSYVLGVKEDAWCFVSNFKASSRSCEKRILVSSCQSVRLPAWNNSAPSGQIFLKFHISVFFENLLRNSKFQ
jgi:hypothetical protein